MASISDLSQDLVEKILSRVPMTSLRAIRSTCKLWNTICKDSRFKYCGKAAKEIMVIMMYDFKACLMSFNLHNHEDLADPFIKQIGNLKQVEFSLVFHCNGLLLCLTYCYTNSRLVVWNPYSGKTRWIQREYDYQKSGLDMDIYTMGYDSNNNHKILKLSYWCGNVYEIYDFKSNSWTVLPIQWCIYGNGVCLKGNNYFIAKERLIKRKEELKDCLLCFDFTRERFLGLPLPCPFRMNDSVVLSVVSEEKLAVLFRRDDALEMEIWITNKIDPNAVSWSHFLKVDEIDIPSYRFHTPFGGFLVDEKKRVAMLFDKDFETRDSCYIAYMVGEAGQYYSEVDLGKSVCQPFICSPYIPSLVEIQ